jgi:hypothetical protein
MSYKHHHKTDSELNPEALIRAKQREIEIQNYYEYLESNTVFATGYFTPEYFPEITGYSFGVYLQIGEEKFDFNKFFDINSTGYEWIMISLAITLALAKGIRGFKEKGSFVDENPRRRFNEELSGLGADFWKLTPEDQEQRFLSLFS